MKTFLQTARITVATTYKTANTVKTDARAAWQIVQSATCLVATDKVSNPRKRLDLSSLFLNNFITYVNNFGIFH